MRISDWSSDVCSSDLLRDHVGARTPCRKHPQAPIPPSTNRLRCPTVLPDPAKGPAGGVHPRHRPHVGKGCPASAACSQQWHRTASRQAIGRAHVYTPHTKSHLVCRSLLEKYKNTQTES